MEPLEGMAVVGQYPARFNADLAVAMLGDAGIQGVVLADPAHAVAPHHVTERGFRVAVREEVAEDAVVLLTHDNAPARAEVDALDDLFHRRRFRERPRWVRRSTILVLAAVGGPVVIAALLQLSWLVERLFP